MDLPLIYKLLLYTGMMKWGFPGTFSSPRCTSSAPLLILYRRGDSALSSSWPSLDTLITAPHLVLVTICQMGLQGQSRGGQSPPSPSWPSLFGCGPTHCCTVDLLLLTHVQLFVHCSLLEPVLLQSFLSAVWVAHGLFRWILQSCIFVILDISQKERISVLRK